MYSKEHVDAVSARLREYEEALASPEFRVLKPCLACHSANYSCRACLFNGKESSGGCFNDNGRIGDSCRNKQEQREQFNHLLSKLAEAGYEFK